jgi:hypothetical protein
MITDVLLYTYTHTYDTQSPIFNSPSYTTDWGYTYELRDGYLGIGFGRNENYRDGQGFTQGVNYFIGVGPIHEYMPNGYNKPGKGVEATIQIRF